ncbi:MAG: hypothetical protein WD342_15560 [Verrucomicrobiales bacterium]
MPTEKLRPDSYAAQIAEATGAPFEILAILERIMREEVFHSTLDWQTATQFRAGARKAHHLYLDDAEFYDAVDRQHQASYRLLGAENALAEARQSGAAPDVLAAAELAWKQARFEEAAANASLADASAR